MKVLHIIPAFYPATYYGGPVYSTYGSCNALARIPEVELRVLTTDSAGPNYQDRVKVDSFPTSFADGYKVYYCQRWLGADISPGLLLRLFSMIQWADVIHLTGVYSPPTIPTLLVCRLLKKPVLWSPRGALQRWDGSTNKLAKKIWEKICNLLCDVNLSVLHFTTKEEQEGSAGRIKNVNSVVIPNGVGISSAPALREWRPDGKLRLLYLGRLHPIKGIENLLHAMQNLERDISLSIYGDGDPDYKKSLESLTTRLALQDRVRFNGRIHGELKTACFNEADVCVVPSFTENFGMVIAEALAHGVPVIASKGAPWSRIEEQGCGYWVDNSPEVLTQTIQRIKQQNLQDMGLRGQDWVKNQFSWQSVAQQMCGVYRQLISRS